MENKHILSILTENRPGVLCRIAGLFNRRGFNIESISAGPTSDESMSRWTIILNGDDATLEQVTKQVSKLIDTIKIKTHKSGSSVTRELALIKVCATSETRSEIIQIVDIFRSNIVDVSLDSITIEVSGDKDKLIALTDMLQPFGILESVKTGVISIERGTKKE